MPKNLTATQASLTALFIYIVGQAVAFVPSLSSSQQNLISAGSLVIAAVFALIHLVEHFAAAGSGVTLTDLESGIRSLAKDEIAKVPFTQIAESALDGKGLSDPKALVQSELNKILLRTGFESLKTAPAPDPTSPVGGVAPTVASAPAAGTVPIHQPQQA